MDEEPTVPIPLPPWMVDPDEGPQPNRPMAVVYWLLGSALVVLGVVLTLITKWL